MKKKKKKLSPRIQTDVEIFDEMEYAGRLTVNLEDVIRSCQQHFILYTCYKTLSPVDDWLLAKENSCHPHTSPQDKTFVEQAATQCPYYIKGSWEIHSICHGSRSSSHFFFLEKSVSGQQSLFTKN
jgi:hypothetical protein